MTSPAAPDASGPILASWKVSEVLRRYPDLVDTFVAISPAFRPLRNPIGRRTQARLVTVAQAASIGGVEPTALVRALNVAAGLTPPGPDATAPTETTDPDTAPPWVAQATVAGEFDARPVLNRGEEPFQAIMQAARAVPAGQALVVHAPFEPLPLYDVFARRGFAAWGKQVGLDHWQVLFLNQGPPASAAPERTPAPSSTTPLADLDWDAPTATVTIDVSELVPPEPMVKILEALAELPPGGTLLVHHVRRPVHLYPRLDDLGCRYETRDLGPGRVELRIQKPVNEDAA